LSVNGAAVKITTKFSAPKFEFISACSATVQLLNIIINRAGLTGEIRQEKI